MIERKAFRDRLWKQMGRIVYPLVFVLAMALLVPVVVATWVLDYIIVWNTLRQK